MLQQGVAKPGRSEQTQHTTRNHSVSNEQVSSNVRLTLFVTDRINALVERAGMLNDIISYATTAAIHQE